MTRPGTVYLVGAGPGDPELLTLRGQRLLELADVVLHDELVPRAILGRISRSATIENVGKRGREPAEKQVSQATIDARLVELARSGKNVVRLKGGDPFLFGRGSEEALALSLAGIPFEVVPGVSSGLAAAYAGISLTHRDLASSVVFLSGTTRDKREFDFRELRNHTGTVVIFMGLGRLRSLAASLVSHAQRSPTTEVAVIQSVTQPEQRVVTGTLADIADRVAEAGLITPALVIVGAVVSLRESLQWFDRKPLFGKRVLVPRSEHQSTRAAELLRERGALAIELPLLRIAPVEDRAALRAALKELGNYNVVVFTSENAVNCFGAELSTAGLDARAFRSARIAAVGDATARALYALGVRADIVPAEFRAEALAQAVLDDLTHTQGTPAGAHVLLPRARVAREVLPELLRASGVHVDIVSVYETLPTTGEEAASIRRLIETKSLDAILLLSGSMVDALVSVVGQPAAEQLTDVALVSIGPVTTAAAEARGLTLAQTAEQSSIESLIETLESAMRR